MNCLEFRRLVLIDPNPRAADRLAHADQCAECRAFLREMQGLEGRLSDALLVHVPEGLEDRVLLRHRTRPGERRAWYAAAAAVLLSLASLSYHLASPPREPATQQVFGAAEQDMATVAISFVLDEEPHLLQQGRRGDPAILRNSLLRLGLNLPNRDVVVRYLGKCPVPGGTGDHVVLSGPWGQVTLILVPDQRLSDRKVVSHRERIAIAAPARDGGYILIADSLTHAKKLEDMML
jgi:hypothetical protein